MKLQLVGLLTVLSMVALATANYMQPMPMYKGGLTGYSSYAMPMPMMGYGGMAGAYHRPGGYQGIFGMLIFLFVFILMIQLLFGAGSGIGIGGTRGSVSSSDY